MQKKEIIDKCNRIKQLLGVSDLGSSFEMLEGVIVSKQDARLADSLNGLRTTYKYLASYMLDGGKDDSRADMVHEITEGMRSICDNIIRDEIAVDSSDSYSETLRYLRLSGGNIDELLDKYARVYSEYTLGSAAGNDITEIEKELEDISNRLFNIAWTGLNDKKVTKATVQAIRSNKYGDALPVLLLNALLLSVCGYFDRYKLSALFDVYESELSDELTARALLGIVLCLNRYPDRSEALKEITDRLRQLQDSPEAYKRLKEVVLGIVRTRDTDRVAAKMKDEVIPEIMKLSPEILKKLREGGAESLDMGMLENNPEWEEMMEKSGLNEKMRELNEMQSEGSDLMMVAFSNLKGFPFFNSVSNWFLPFNADHSVIPGGEKERNILDRMMEVGRGVCDSDKYSLAIALGKMPEAQKNMMLSQLDAQFSQMGEEFKDQEFKTSMPRFNEELTKAVRDLYRFFKLYRKKDGFSDPFVGEFNFTDLPVIGNLVSDKEIVEVVAEFYFKRKYFAEALNLFNFLLEENSDDAAIWEKIGFCYQQMKFYDKALEAYTHAELLKSPGSWLLKRLAFVNRRLGNFSAAAGYYKRLLEKEPENVSLILNTAYCELEAGNAEEALPYYYHANYLDPDKTNIFRAIAWCEFLNGNYDKSEKYYDRILASNPDNSDFLNLGHLALVRGENRKAIGYYKKAASEGYDDFRKTFLSDLAILEKAGIERMNAMIILDAVKMNI